MDSTESPTADWHQLANRYYKKKEIYKLDWDVDMSTQILVGGPFAGPFAVTRDDKKLIAVGKESGASLKPTINIYTAAGKLLRSFNWESNQRLVKMGWTNNEKLLCVQEDGVVQVLNAQAELVGSFSMGRDCTGVVDAYIWGAGVVCMTAKPRVALHCAFPLGLEAGGDELRVRRLAEPELKELPISWTVIEPQFNTAHPQSPQVLLATEQGSVVVVDDERKADQLLANGPFLKMAVSPTGKILACFTAAGNLWVVSTDFQKNFSEFPTKSKVAPLQMVWCGADAVVLYWDKLLLLVGPNSQWLKFSYDEPVTLVAEIDAVRVVSAWRHELLHKVQQVVEDTFKIGSTSPPAMLFYALEHFEKKNPKADELIRSIAKDLRLAVDACAEAAGHEWATQVQSTLLRAASFGKCFLDAYPAGAFLQMCMTLRVLNAVRHPSVGIPLTLAEYKALGIDMLIERLLHRHQHGLALKLNEFLKRKTDRVLVHWACLKVRSQRATVDPGGVLEEVVRKLAAVPGVSFAEIASTAYRAGRHELATKLLDYEPRAADQVPLLLSMKEDERALAKAIESGDTDLVYLVVLHLKRTKSAHEFIGMVRTKPIALAVLINYYRVPRDESDATTLKELYENIEQPAEIGALLVQESYKQSEFEGRTRLLQGAVNAYKMAKDASSQLTAALIEDQLKLLLLQKDLESSIGGQFVDQPLYDTLYNVLLSGDVKRGMRIKDSFKVPDKRFYWCRVKALAQTKQWVELEKFSKERKPPIGFEGFADVCIEQSMPNEAAKYAARIATPNVRAEYFMRIMYWKEAADAAREAKDPELLTKIANKSQSREVQNYVEQILLQLRR